MDEINTKTDKDLTRTIMPRGRRFEPSFLPSIYDHCKNALTPTLQLSLHEPENHWLVVRYACSVAEELWKEHLKP